MNSLPEPLSLFITHVSAETACLKLWAQMDVETQNQIETSLMELEPMLESGEGRPHPVDIRPGDICCAKTSENGKWYRAKVTDLSSLANGTVVVKFVDYGNSEVVFINEVRKISHPVCWKPPQATELVLAGVRPMGTSWDDATMDYVKEMIYYREVQGMITGVDGVLPKVCLFIPVTAPEGFANYLINNNRARADTPDNYIYRDIPIGKTVAAFTANVTSLSEFWIHLADGKDELRKMQVELEKFNMSCPKMSRVMVGAPCVTHFSKDGMFYRGQVLTENGINCQVLFVDYGNAEKKLVSELLDIPASLLAVPVQGIKCKLKDSHQMTASEEMVQSFQDMVQDKQLKCNVVGRMEESYVVEVIVDERNVVNNLTEYGRKKSLSPTSSSSSSNPAAYQRKILDIGKAYEVKVSNAASLSSFHCQEISSIASLVQLVKQLEIEMNSACQEVTHAELVPGFTCAMKNETNGDWYRAEVRKIIELGLVEIQCVDYGNVEIVSASRLVRLPSAYARSPPALATECALKGCTHIQPDLVDDFMRLAGTDKLIAKVVEERNGKILVDLHNVTTIPHMHINLEILFLHSLNRSVIPESNLVEIEQVYVVSVQDDGVVLAQLVKTPVETLGRFQEELNSFYGLLSSGSENKYSDNSFHAGEICCAKFSDDDLFYRGKIVSLAKNANAADVFFVDYGNTETKAFGEIKTLAPKFMSFPCQVIQIRIADFVCSAGMLRDNLMDTTIEVRLVQKSNRVHSVVLTNDPMNDDIKNKLAATKSDSVTKMVKKSRTPIPNLRAKEEVIATHVVNSYHICCQLQRSASPLQELLRELSEHCASEDKTDILSDPVVGQAYFTVYFDECYRAEIKRVINPMELENKLLEAETKLKVQVEQTNKLTEELTAVKKSELILLEKELAPMQEKNQELTMQRDEFASESQVLKNELKRWQTRTSQLVEQCNRTSPDELKKANLEKDNLQKQALRVNEEIQRYRAEISRLNTSLLAVQNEVASLKANSVKEKKENDKVNEEIKKMDTQMAELVKTIQQIKKIGRKYKSQYDELKVQYDELKAKNDEMTGGVGDTMTINAAVKQELENKLLEAETKLKVQVEQTNKLTEELTAVKKSEEEAKTQSTLKEERFKKILFGCRQQISKITSQRDAVIKDNEELKKLGVAETASEEGNLRLNSLRSQYEGRISRLEKELKECQEEKESIQQEKEKIQKESEELLNILTQQQKQFIQYQAAKVSPTSSTALMTGSTSSETPPTANIKPLASPTTAPVRGTSNVLSSIITPAASIRPMAIPQARKITQPLTTKSATEFTHDENLSAATHSLSLVPQATVAPTPATLVVTVTDTPTTTNEQNTIASLAPVPPVVDESQSDADPGIMGMPSSSTSPTPSTSDAIVDATSHVTPSAASNLVSATTVTMSNSEENNSNTKWSGNNNCDSPGESGSTLDLEFTLGNIKTEIVPADANTSEVTPSSSSTYDHDSKEVTLKRHREEIIGDDDPDQKRLYGTTLDIKDRGVVVHCHLSQGSANARYGRSRLNAPRWWSSMSWS